MLAREVAVHAPAPHDTAAVFGVLRAGFSSCYVYCAGRGDAAFVGASPELLVRREGLRASTVALAGSTRRSADPAVDTHLGEQLLQSEKDREEQAIVTRRIARALRPLSVWVTAPDEPAIVRVANIQHLATPIRAQLTHPRSVVELAGRLHPTPAVGGEPHATATPLIPAFEGLDRGWYAGPVGWTDANEDGEFCVALRCALLRGAEARLYAGVGVVRDSDPRRSWPRPRSSSAPCSRCSPADGLVEDRGRLPDLPAQLRGRGRGRDRRPRGDHRAARLPRDARRRRALAVAGLPVAAGRQRLRHQRLPGHRPDVRDARGLRRLLAARPRPRDEARHGPRRQPHVRRAPVVRQAALARAARSATGTGGARRARAWSAGDPGAEPTNWRSFFSGPTWELDEASGEYYLHLFSRKQPDLNWENPEVREAVYAMMRWWLDRGVDGFRMDVINMISKDPALPDGQRRRRDGSPYYICGPRIHEFLQEMHREVFAGRPDRLLTVGEMPGVTVDEARLFTDPARAEVDMVFQFEHVQLDQGDEQVGRPPARAARPQGVVRPLAGRARRRRLEQPLLEQPRPAARRVALRRRRRAPGARRRRCSPRSCTCTAGRRTSTRARSSG